MSKCHKKLWQNQCILACFFVSLLKVNSRKIFKKGGGILGLTNERKAKDK